MLFIFVTALAVYTSLTLLQIYYNAYVHLILFGCCIIFSHKPHKLILPLGLGALTCALFMLLSVGKLAITPMSQLGFYLHYITWPVVLVAVLNTFTLKQKLILMRLMLIVAIVGSLCSLRYLVVDPNISRLLAGAATATEMHNYFSKGIGGYGTVYATVFLCFGAIYWFVNTKVRTDRILIIAFLSSAYLFILYASYTTAIIITVIISLLAFTSKVKPMIKSLIVIAIISLLLVLLWDNIAESAINLFSELGLERVVQRLTQLTQASQNNDMSSLQRTQLYIKSFEAFIEHPLKGGNVAGEHSQILDTLAYFGIAGFFMPLLLGYYSMKCIKLSSIRLSLFYIMFFALITVNTCSAMQIPVMVFCVCPLIVNTVKEQRSLAKTKKEQIVVKETSV